MMNNARFYPEWIDRIEQATTPYGMRDVCQEIAKEMATMPPSSIIAFCSDLFATQEYFTIMYIMGMLYAMLEQPKEFPGLDKVIQTGKDKWLTSPSPAPLAFWAST